MICSIRENVGADVIRCLIIIIIIINNAHHPIVYVHQRKLNSVHLSGDLVLVKEPVLLYTGISHLERVYSGWCILYFIVHQFTQLVRDKEHEC